MNTFSTYLQNFWKSIVAPTVRLPISSFPWTLSKATGTYGVALVFFFLGSIAPILILIGAAFASLYLFPSYEFPLEWFISSRTGYLALIIITFVSGFAAELWYLNRELRKDGHDWKELIALNGKSLGNSVFSIAWRGILTCALLYAASELIALLTPRQIADPAVEMIKSFGGWQRLVLYVLIILGPIYEEIIFRGFMFNMFRASLAKKISPRWAELGAIAISSAAFALIHFNLSGFLSYFLLGAVLAESYRRSGSLYVSIVAHCLNNALAVVMVAYSLS